MTWPPLSVKIASTPSAASERATKRPPWSDSAIGTADTTPGEGLAKRLRRRASEPVEELGDAVDDGVRAVRLVEGLQPAAPLIPLRTRIVREPPMRPSATSMVTSSPITATSSVGTPRRSRTVSSAASDGLPTMTGSTLLAFASAAVTIAPRLKIGPFAPA